MQVQASLIVQCGQALPRQQQIRPKMHNKHCS